MANPFGAPEISVQEVEQKRQAGDSFILLDVREPYEQQLASIDDERVLEAPLSQLAERKVDALPAATHDKAAEIIVFCHHGARSAQVTAWLRSQGWSNVSSMTGGIDAWADEIDSDVDKY